MTNCHIAEGPYGMTDVQFYRNDIPRTGDIRAVWLPPTPLRAAVVVVQIENGSANKHTFADAWCAEDNEEAKAWLLNMVLVKLVPDDGA